MQQYEESKGYNTATVNAEAWGDSSIQQVNESIF